MRGYNAEHEFVQMPCGVMDQLISSCGQYGKVSLIDCISHDIQHFDISSDIVSDRREWPVTLLKLFVHTEHKLVNSQYTERVKECLEAERLLKERYNNEKEQPVEALCRGPTLEMLENMKESMPANVYRRAYYVRVWMSDETDDSRDRAHAAVRGVDSEGRLGRDWSFVLPVVR